MNVYDWERYKIVGKQKEKKAIKSSSYQNVINETELLLIVTSTIASDMQN
jgi:hypothetical protein